MLFSKSKGVMFIRIKNNAVVPTNDYVFKRIFGHVGNEEITKSLVSSIIGRKINSINLEGNTILEKDLLDDKLGILDIKAKLDDMVYCDIEMQVLNNKNIEKRIMYYWSKMYAAGIKRGEDFINLKKSISILIANFELDNLNNISKFHTEWKIREKEYSKIVLTEVLEIHIIELPKLIYLIENDYKQNDKLVIWSKFLLNPDKLEDYEMANNEDIKLAKNELDKLNEDEYEQRIAELRQKHILDTKSMISYGYDKGLEEGKKEIAKRLIAKGLDIKEIMDITKLTREDIENIIKGLK